MSEPMTTATLVLGDDIRKQIGARLGLTDDELDDVPIAIEISLPETEGFATTTTDTTTLPLVRLHVRSILTSSPSFRSLPPDKRKDLAHDMVRVL